MDDETKETKRKRKLVVEAMGGATPAPPARPLQPRSDTNGGEQDGTEDDPGLDGRGATTSGGGRSRRRRRRSSGGCGSGGGRPGGWSELGEGSGYSRRGCVYALDTTERRRVLDGGQDVVVRCADLCGVG